MMLEGKPAPSFGDDRLCTLVVIGARPVGKEELLAVEDGYRERPESWKMLLRETQAAQGDRAGPGDR